MKAFEIQYISRYCEEKNYYAEIIEASSEKAALKKFAKLFGIRNYEQLLSPTFIWEDGSWMSRFKCINEIEIIVCPHCGGNGKVIANK